MNYKLLNKRQRKQNEQSNLNNPETLAKLDTQEDDKQSTTQINNTDHIKIPGTGNSGAREGQAVHVSNKIPPRYS